MSATISLILDPGPWQGPDYLNSWPVGGTITGTVRVSADTNTKARGVRVELRWRTEGRGSTDSETVQKTTLQEGDISAGSDWELKFEFPIPTDGPITYDGHYIHVRWEVAAIIDIPWARDTKDVQPITILPTYESAT